MKCQFCQDQEAECAQDSCPACYDWIVKDTTTFKKVFENSKIICIWCFLPRHDLTVYFNLSKKETVVGKKIVPERAPVTEQIVIQLGYLVPVTQKFLDEVPKKLKVWNMFS